MVKVCVRLQNSNGEVISRDIGDVINKNKNLMRAINSALGSDYKVDDKLVSLFSDSKFNGAISSALLKFLNSRPHPLNVRARKIEYIIPACVSEINFPNVGIMKQPISGYIIGVRTDKGYLTNKFVKADVVTGLSDGLKIVIGDVVLSDNVPTERPKARVITPSKILEVNIRENTITIALIKNRVELRNGKIVVVTDSVSTTIDNKGVGRPKERSKSEVITLPDNDSILGAPVLILDPVSLYAGKIQPAYAMALFDKDGKLVVPADKKTSELFGKVVADSILKVINGKRVATSVATFYPLASVRHPVITFGRVEDKFYELLSDEALLYPPVVVGKDSVSVAFPVVTSFTTGKALSIETMDGEVFRVWKEPSLVVVSHYTNGKTVGVVVANPRRGTFKAMEVMVTGSRLKGDVIEELPAGKVKSLLHRYGVYSVFKARGNVEEEIVSLDDLSEGQLKEMLKFITSEYGKKYCAFGNRDYCYTPISKYYSTPIFYFKEKAIDRRVVPFTNNVSVISNIKSIGRKTQAKIYTIIKKLENVLGGKVTKISYFDYTYLHAIIVVIEVRGKPVVVVFDQYSIFEFLGDFNYNFKRNINGVVSKIRSLPANRTLVVNGITLSSREAVFWKVGDDYVVVSEEGDVIKTNVFKFPLSRRVMKVVKKYPGYAKLLSIILSMCQNRMVALINAGNYYNLAGNDSIVVDDALIYGIVRLYADVKLTDDDVRKIERALKERKKITIMLYIETEREVVKCTEEDYVACYDECDEDGYCIVEKEYYAVKLSD